MFTTNSARLLYARQVRELVMVIEEKQQQTVFPIQDARVLAAQLETAKELLARALDGTGLGARSARRAHQVDETELEEGMALHLQAEMKLSEIKIFIETHSAPTTAPRTQTNQVIQSKLPKLEIEKFNGDILKFNEFWQMFESNIHSNETLKPVEKFQFLASYLTGKAKDCIEGLAHCNENYETAVDLLKERFGDNQVLITRHYTELNSIRKAERNVGSLRATYDKIEKHVRCLQNLGENVEQNIFITIIMSKFPPYVNLDIEKQRLDEVLTTRTLLTSLKRIITAQERVYSHPTRTEHYEGTSKSPHFTTETLLGAEGPKMRCLYCSEFHWSDECPKFDTLAKREAKVKERCRLCMNRNHIDVDCSSQKACFHCKKTRVHHRSLCPRLFRKEEVETQPSEAGLLSASEYVSLQTVNAQLVHPRTAESIWVRGILDTGSHRTYVTERISAKLKLKSLGKQTLSLLVFGKSRPINVATSLVEINIQLGKDQCMTLSANVVPEIVGKFCTEKTERIHQSLKTVLGNRVKELSDQNTSDPIEILIGNDYYYDIVKGNRQEIQPGLHLIETKLGLVVSGRLRERLGAQQEVSFLTYSTGDKFYPETNEWGECSHIPYHAEKTFSNELKNLWELDVIGIRDSPEDTGDDLAIKNFNLNIHLENKRYFVALPWKTYPPNLQTNYGLALGRLKSLVGRIKDAELLQKYDSIFQEQLALNIIESVTRTTEPTVVHYLPHHAVITPQKTTTKVRIVFDGSAKTRKSELCLNECLLRGRVLLEDLTGILVKFRTAKYILSADVEKAFLQIGIRRQDRDVTRFLWLKDLTKPPNDDNLQIYRFTRVPFGLISSPFLMLAVIKHHLNVIGTPVAKKMEENFYMDNLILGCQTTEEVFNLYEEALSIMKRANMNLREWCTNEINLRTKLGQSEDEVVSVLGLKWQVKKDLLTICMKPFQADSLPITKRQVVSIVSSVFDPLGYVSPVTLNAKLFLRKLTEARYGWEDHLGEELRQEWIAVYKKLEQILEVKIPRYIGRPEGCGDLHCFVDASQVAFSFTIYLQFGSSGGFVSRLLFAKSRLAPNTPITIPRLELLGMLIGARAIEFLSNQLEFSIAHRYIWTDSKCVLYWLHSNKILPLFVQRRVAEIKSKTGIVFCYVPSNQNPADWATRGKDISDLSDFWWQGPDWLSKSKEFWPEAQIDSIESWSYVDEVSDLPISTEALPSIVIDPRDSSQWAIDHHKYSSLSKLLRITSYCLRFIKKCRKLSNLRGQFPTPHEMKASKLLWEKHVQSALFDQKAETQNKLKSQLGIWQDDKQLYRCKGRVISPEMRYDENFPILLPNNSHYTNLVIGDFHKRMGHAGVAHTLAEMRKYFWVIKGRSVVRKVLRRCLQCQRWSGQAYKLPQMPLLPVARITRSLAFTNTGADYFGHLYALDQGQPIQVWVCLFTCLATRGIHLELVTSMTAEDFLMALRRFVARRGQPEHITTDNANQFKLAQRVIGRQIGFSGDYMEWHFTPELAPWFGGFYERLVSMVKTSLRRTIGKCTLTLSQLNTFIAETEAIINSRPLVYVGEDIESNNILTPAHFLSLRENTLFQSLPTGAPTPSITQRRLIEAWSKGQHYLQEFWKIWSSEYMASLRERTQRAIRQKRGVVSEEPREGTVVHISSNLPRASWRIARIEKLMRGRDGKTRVANLRLPNGTRLSRSIAQLYPLEMQEDEIER